jgi:O-antigen/teichoic acid export membrane protein
MSARRFSANLSYNIFGALLPLATSLATVPLYIHQIGLARYGVVTITWVLLGYFGFLDFGLSRASANALAKLGDAGPQARSPVLVTAFTCNLLLGLAGGLVLYAVGHEVLAHFMKIPDALSRETQQSFPWMAAMLPLGMLSGVSTGALESRERFLLSNALNSFGTMAGQVVPLVCAYAIGPSLNVVIPATLLTRLFSVALAYAVVIRLEWPLRLFDVSLTWMKRLFGYGSWVTISGLLNPLLDTSNQLIVGGMLGAASVALYSVPMTLAQRAQVLATALSRTLFPKNSRDTHADAVATTRRATLSLAYGLGMVCGPAILVAAPFLHLWVGARFAGQSGAVAQILMFGAWANGVAFLPYGFIQARGKPHITAIVGMVEIIPFFLVLWLLIHLLGLPGAALAWTLRVTINCVALFVLSRTLPENLWRLAPAVGLMVAALATALLVPMGGLAALGGAIVLGLVFVTCAYRLDPVLRGTVLGLGRRAGILRALGDPSQA